jgi:DNA-binding IclR family transcriptional regulator
MIPTCEPGRVSREHPSTAAQLAQVRADEYAISRSANRIGSNAVAAALLDPADGAALGSVAVAADEQRLRTEPGRGDRATAGRPRRHHPRRRRLPNTDAVEVTRRSDSSGLV